MALAICIWLALGVIQTEFVHLLACAIVLMIPLARDTHRLASRCWHAKYTCRHTVGSTSRTAPVSLSACVRRVLAETGVQPSRCLFIGDGYVGRHGCMLYCTDLSISTSISELASQPINVTLLCSSIAHVTLNVDTVIVCNLKSEWLDICMYVWHVCMACMYVSCMYV